MANPRVSLFSSMRHKPLQRMLQNRLLSRSVSFTSLNGSPFIKSRNATASTASTCFRPSFQCLRLARPFSSSSTSLDWLTPDRNFKGKQQKGRPRVCTGGSVKGTTVVWGDYGLRMVDHDRRISAAQLRNGEDVIRRRLRGMPYRLYMRINAGTAVYTKGNEVRMGTGKGSFDHWAARVAVSRVIFEIKAAVHEQVIRDAFRLAANKLPGNYEFVKRGDAPVMGITKLTNGVTEADLRRPRKKLPGEVTASRLPGPPAELGSTV